MCTSSKSGYPSPNNLGKFRGYSIEISQVIPQYLHGIILIKILIIIILVVVTLDTSSAEFLLGRIASDIFGRDDNVYETPLYSKKSRLIHALIPIIYSLIVLITVVMLMELSQPYVYFTIFMIIPLIIVASYKNVFLFNNYAPDLAINQNNKFKFTTVQIIISYFFSSLISIGLSFALILLANYQINLTVILFIILIVSGFYVFILSDLGLLSLATGLNMISFTAGFKNIINNIKELLRLSNHTSRKLAMARISLMISYFLILSSGVHYGFLGIPIFLYLMYYYNNEKINASSSMMSIRAYLNDVTPATLPRPLAVQVADTPTEKTETVSQVGREPEHSQVHSQNSNEKKDRSVDRLVPYASKTIHKIIKQVRGKPLNNTIFKICTECNIKLSATAQYCHTCGGMVE